MDTEPGSMEGLEVNNSMVNPSFWKGKKVLLTGHTGFKGSWLSIWLLQMGAKVIGYSIDIPTEPSLFKLAGLSEKVDHCVGDICDVKKLFSVFKAHTPDMVIHMAAQPLVRLSYKSPIETYNTNVMGTANVLECIRMTPSVKVGVMITTDKCYENKEWVYAYREHEPMGGYDPYSSSKGAAELVISAYQRSFFNKNDSPTIVSTRAGNVIGGGDWAEDRLIPDIVRAIERSDKVKIRNPLAIRPWQHVLEPLSGYLLLAQKCFDDKNFQGAWNFGPSEEDAKNVAWVADRVAYHLNLEELWEKDGEEHPHEATYLKLDSSKAAFYLRWKPKWDADTAIKKTVNWYRDQKYLKSNEEVYKRCSSDLNEYLLNQV